MACVLHGMARIPADVPVARSLSSPGALAGQGGGCEIKEPSSIQKVRGVEQSARRSTQRRLRDVQVPPRRINLLPYPCSECSSTGSDFPKVSNSQKSPQVVRGLLLNDITYAHENTPGVCVLKQMSSPTFRDFEDPNCLIRLNAATEALRRAEEADMRARRRAFRPPSPAGSSLGDPCEVLTKAMHKTVGKPSMTRPMRGNDKDKQTKYFLAPDSFFSSEHRSRFYWRETDELTKKELKMHVFPSFCERAFPRPLPK